MDKCPECGCPFFNSTGASTADCPTAWKDEDGKWYCGPANQWTEYSCSGCGYSYKITKKRGKVIEDTRRGKSLDI